MIRDELAGVVRAALIHMGVENPAVNLDHPADIAHGDYSTNAALAYSKQQKVAPRVFAEKLVSEIEKVLGDAKLLKSAKVSKDLKAKIAGIEIAGPGFVNFRLTRDFFAGQVAEIVGSKSFALLSKSSHSFGTNTRLEGKKITIEYTDPNPFKIFHIGHLMSNAIGESISRVIEANGAHVTRLNYQGDVGLHVAKAVWGMLQNEADFPKEDASLEEMIKYINASYVSGSTAFDDEGNTVAREEIALINKMIFDRSNPKLMRIYNWGRKVSLLNFEVIYKKLGTRFDKYFFESEVAGDGAIIVKDFLKRGVFVESNGAIVFPGEKYGLNTRVFITSQGLPTYEAKEVGLTRIKFDKYNPDLSIVVTASEQDNYFKVVEKALFLMFPYLEGRMRHVSHGMLRLPSGKMSSRTGAVITGESLLADVADLVAEKMRDREGISPEDLEQIITDVSVGAIKYSILKQATGGDIIYDFDKSISFEGDSGPYLQYACVRAKSLLAKADAANIKRKFDPSKVKAPATLLEKMLYRFPEVVMRAGDSYEPHHIATYLIELSAAFNNYYANTQIIGAAGDAKADTDAPYRIALTEAFSIIMEKGLGLLGIRVPSKM